MRQNVDWSKQLVWVIFFALIASLNPVGCKLQAQPVSLIEFQAGIRNVYPAPFRHGLASLTVSLKSSTLDPVADRLKVHPPEFRVLLAPDRPAHVEVTFQSPMSPVHEKILRGCAEVVRDSAKGFFDTYCDLALSDLAGAIPDHARVFRDGPAVILEYWIDTPEKMLRLEFDKRFRLRRLTLQNSTLGWKMVTEPTWIEVNQNFFLEGWNTRSWKAGALDVSTRFFIRNGRMGSLLLPREVDFFIEGTESSDRPAMVFSMSEYDLGLRQTENEAWEEKHD